MIISALTLRPLESHQRRKERCSGSYRQAVGFIASFDIVKKQRTGPSWKVDRVLANQRLNLTAASQVASNVPKAWFLVLGCNRQDGKGETIERESKETAETT